MWFAYLYRRGADASTWTPDPDEVAAATTEAECVTGILEPPWDLTYELGVDPLPPQIPDIRPELLVPVPRMFARLDTDDWTGQTYEYVGVVENPTAPLPQPPNPLPRAPLEEHSVQAIHLLPEVGMPGQLLVLDAQAELSWQAPGTTGLADGSVTTPKLADGAVTDLKIATSTITGAKLVAATITADKLAPGVVPAPPGAASDTTPGLIQIATTAEVQTGTDTTKAVTPGRLGGRTATETRTGLVELATTAEAVAGTDTIRAVTPAGLEARIATIPAQPAASEATAGILRLATQAEVTTGTDDMKAVTPLKLATRLVNATETQRGLLELATTAEVTTGSTDAAAVTPLKLQQRLTDVLPQAASETVAGLVELATQAEVTTGTDDLRAVTPLKVSTLLTTRVPNGTPLAVPRYASSGQSLETSPLSVDANSNLRLGTAAPGTSAQRAVVLSLGVAPTAAHPSDAVQMWVADQEGVAGQAALHVRHEGGVLTVLGTGLLSRMVFGTASAHGVAAPLVLTVEQSNKLFLCNNPSEIQGIQLPSGISAGIVYTFVNYQASPRGTRILAQAGQTIRLGANVSASGGSVQSQTMGDYVQLAAISSSVWIALSPSMGWTVT